MRPGGHPSLVAAHQTRRQSRTAADDIQAPLTSTKRTLRSADKDKDKTAPAISNKRQKPTTTTTTKNSTHSSTSPTSSTSRQSIDSFLRPSKTSTQQRPSRKANVKSTQPQKMNKESQASAPEQKDSKVPSTSQKPLSSVSSSSQDPVESELDQASVSRKVHDAEDDDSAMDEDRDQDNTDNVADTTGGNKNKKSQSSKASQGKNSDGGKDGQDDEAKGGDNKGQGGDSEGNGGETKDEEDHEDEDENEDDDEDDEDEENYADEADPHPYIPGSTPMDGMTTGMSSRLKGMLTNLRAHENPSIQLITLQDLSVLLSVSTEDTLSGYISCDSFVKELVILLRGTGDGDDNPEMMLLACRCLSNLTEAMPTAMSSVVYNGAIPHMCTKLIEIQYIDLAEQCLTMLEKVSIEYPQAVVKEGGLAAALMFLDFFPTNVQRTAVKLVANCCRGVHTESLPMILDILPNLRNIFTGQDQVIVENVCLCYVQLAECFRNSPSNLEVIFTNPILQDILGLLAPNAHIVVRPSTYSKLLHFFSTIAENSPQLGVNLMEMDIVDTLYLALTGLQAPAKGSDLEAPIRVPSIVRRTKDQLYEILGIVNELLPPLPKIELFDPDKKLVIAPKAGDQKPVEVEDVEMESRSESEPPSCSDTDTGADVKLMTESVHEVAESEETLPEAEEPKQSHDSAQGTGGGSMEEVTEIVDGSNDNTQPVVDLRLQLLASHSTHTSRFGRIMIPTLLEAYSSTVNLKVRQRAILSLVKLIYFTPADLLESILKDIGIASFLAIIFTQQEHQSLVINALQIADLLTEKLPEQYCNHFEREGVVFEISKIVKTLEAEKAERQLKLDQEEAAKLLALAGKEVASKEASVKNPVGDLQIKPVLTTTESTKKSSMNDPALKDPKQFSEILADLRRIRGARSTDPKSDELGFLEQTLSEAWAQYRAGASDSFLDFSLSDDFGSSLAGLRAHLTAAATKVQPANSEDKTKEWILERARIIEARCDRSLDDLNGTANGTNSALGQLRKLTADLASPHPKESTLAIHSLAQYFSGSEAAASTFELLSSGLLEGLLKYLTDTSMDQNLTRDERICIFIKEFMSASAIINGQNPGAAVGGLVKKLQEALTRIESFEVNVAHSLANDRRNPTSSLASQLRLKLTPEEGTEVPPGYNNLVISIHAIATFRTLDEYLQPRLRMPQKKIVLDTTSKSKATKTTPAEMPATPATATSTNTNTRVTRRSSRLASKAQGRPPTEEPSAEAKDADNDVELRSAKDPSEGEEDFEESDDDDKMGLDFDDDELDYALRRRGSLQAALNIDKPAEAADLDVEMTDVSGQSPPASEPATKATPEPTPSKDTKAETSRSSQKVSPSLAASSSRSGPSSSWHFQFTLNDIVLDSDSTVYKAIYEYDRQHSKDGSLSKNMWTSVYPIRFKRVNSPPPKPSSSALQSTKDLTATATAADDVTFTAKMPKELEGSGDFTAILGLLRVLYGLNDDCTRFLTDNGADPTIEQVFKLGSHEFVNNKITAKVNRQLEEPLIVASACLPRWVIGLAAGFPFLLPFETRYVYLQSTAFGFSRSVMRWQNQQQRHGHSDQREESQPFLGRIQRQKVRISRQRALESAVRVMDLYGSNQAILEVEYFDEVGTGLGPTLEFYALVSKEFCRRSLKLWRESDSDARSEYVSIRQGLFPMPMSAKSAALDNGRKILNLFTSLGQFVAKAMLDSRIIDIPFNPLFINKLLDRYHEPSLQLLKSVDPVLAKSLQGLSWYVQEKKRVYALCLPAKEREVQLQAIQFKGATVDDMSLDFTMPGCPEVELKPEGEMIPVTIYNVEEYVDLVIDMAVGSGVQAPVNAFKTGFNRVFTIQDLKGFQAGELVQLFGSGDEDWSFETLLDCIKADHGFQIESRAIKNLLRIMSEYDVEERQQFLRFITGSPKLPIGGFKNLHPALTVVCKPYEAPLKADDYLPSVMTCVNYLKMPDYSTKEVTKAKLKMAIEEGQGSFHLS